MKYLGLVLAAAGCALLVFALYSFYKRQNRLRSPVPYVDDVKVITVTPTR